MQADFCVILLLTLLYCLGDRCFNRRGSGALSAPESNVYAGASGWAPYTPLTTSPLIQSQSSSVPMLVDRYAVQSSDWCLSRPLGLQDLVNQMLLEGQSEVFTHLHLGTSCICPGCIEPASLWHILPAISRYA